MILKQSALDVIKVDIRSLLYEDELDVEAVNKRIDQKYEIKKAKMKSDRKAKENSSLPKANIQFERIMDARKG